MGLRLENSDVRLGFFRIGVTIASFQVRREVAMEKGRVNNRCYDGKKNVKTRDD